MVNFGPLTAQIHSGVWGTPANFNGFRIAGDALLWQHYGNVWQSPAVIRQAQRTHYARMHQR